MATAKDFGEVAGRAYGKYASRYSIDEWEDVPRDDQNRASAMVRTFHESKKETNVTIRKRLMVQAHLTSLVKEGWERGKFNREKKLTPWFFIYDDLPDRLKDKIDWFYECVEEEYDL